LLKKTAQFFAGIKKPRLQARFRIIQAGHPAQYGAAGCGGTVA
jgi:hypothetical protein